MRISIGLTHTIYIVNCMMHFDTDGWSADRDQMVVHTVEMSGTKPTFVKPPSWCILREENVED